MSEREKEREEERKRKKERERQGGNRKTDRQICNLLFVRVGRLKIFELFITFLKIFFKLFLTPVSVDIFHNSQTNKARELWLGSKEAP